MDKTDKPKILIVDDNLKELKPLRRFLGEQGFRVSVAPDGEQALEVVGQNLPDLVLLDVLMPGMNGFETCRHFKENEAFKEIPVLFMTGLKDTIEKVKGFELGGVDYLIKPVDHDEVLARINTHLKIRQLQQQLQVENSRFHQLAEATLEGIVIYDRERIIDCNHVIARISGYTRSELIGKHVRDFLTPESHKTLSAHFSRETDEPHEAEGLTKSGNVCPIQVQVRDMTWQRQPVRVAAILDLSWRKELERKHTQLKKERYKFGNIIGKSSIMQALYDRIETVAASDATVSILGESGTGKELVALTIHHLSERKDQPFVAVNCGAVAESLFEREFFGNRKGAFTGAHADTPGYFDRAQGGTLFLDEVGEIPQTMQVKLLRALQEKTYLPIGGTQEKHVDVRILTATNKNLHQLMQKGIMREDFYYRINVVELTVPPLRERQEDIPLLVEHFLGQSENGDCPCSPIPGNVMDLMCGYHWPGNVRELQNEITHFQATKGHLKFMESIESHSIETEVLNRVSSQERFSLQKMVDDFEKRVILDMLEKNRHNKTATATMLDIDRKTLYTKLKKHGVN